MPTASPITPGFYPESSYTIAMYFPPPYNCSSVCCPIVIEGRWAREQKGEGLGFQGTMKLPYHPKTVWHFIRGLLETQCLPPEGCRQS